jgi:hypothetical protein
MKKSGAPRRMVEIASQALLRSETSLGRRNEVSLQFNNRTVRFAQILLKKCAVD